MTNKEFWEYFNLCYNNVTSNEAAGILKSEANQFINRTIDAFVDGLYGQAEQNEAALESLGNLVVQTELSTEYTGSAGTHTGQTNVPKLTNESKLYLLPDELLYILVEQIYLKNSIGGCDAGRMLKVRPTTHDTFHTIYHNPFKYNKNIALRFNISSNNNRLAEIIVKQNQNTRSNNIAKYVLRYVKKPAHIDLTDTSLYNTEQCDLNPKFHKQIVETAAQMCAAYYKQ